MIHLLLGLLFQKCYCVSLLNARQIANQNLKGLEKKHVCSYMKQPLTKSYLPNRNVYFNPSVYVKIDSITRFLCVLKVAFVEKICKII